MFGAGLLLGILLSFLLFRPAIAQAPKQKNEVLQDPNLLVQHYVPITPPSNQRPRSAQSSGRHSTRAEKQISIEQLTLFLQSKGSPLTPYAAQILESPYWSTIIGICTIEQYSCTHAPYNNYWGIMRPGGGLQRFATMGEAINAIDSLLAKYEARGKRTIEELNGYYVVPASTTWLNTVLTTKLHLESLQ